MYSTSRIISVWLAVLSLVALACSDGADEATTTAAPSNIEFGSGEIPDSVPEDFPMLDSAVISSTLVNNDTGYTEMIVRMPAELGIAVQYYQSNLPTSGWEVTESSATSDTKWQLTATGFDTTVTIDFGVIGSQVTELVFTFEPI